MICVICDDTDFAFRWTDTHGVGACFRCGAPYEIYHYEGEGENRRRVPGPPKCELKAEWIPLIRRYWQETKRNVAPGAFNMPGSSYEVASQADADSLNAWFKAHEAELPKAAPS